MDTTLIKSLLKALIQRFTKGPEKKKIIYVSLQFSNSISGEENPTSIAKKFFDAIKECKRVTDLDTQLSKEIDLFTFGSGRG